MRKYIFTLLAALALALPATALAGGDHWALTLNATPSTVAVGDSLTLAGQLTNYGHGLGNKTVTISGYANSECEGDPYATADLTTNNDSEDKGNYSFSGTVGLSPGDYSFRSTANGYGEGTHVSSSCRPVTVTAAPDTTQEEPPAVEASAPVVNHVFLCYSKFQTEPGVWTADEADTLVALGYWIPDAVAGNTYGGTNVGAYHLVCNSKLKQTGFLVNDGGFVYAADYTPWKSGALFALGYYPIVK